MLSNEYRFTVGVSEQCFQNKLAKDDSQWKTIRFQPQEMSVNELLRYAIQGKIFCGCFRTNNEDGSFGCAEKTNDNFISTSSIFFDIDGSEYPMEEFIEKLPYKPTFAYTTLSNGTDGNRFRLGFVFRRDIRGESNFNRMFNAIASANGFNTEGGLDKLPCAQCYFGTTPFADTYSSDYIYSHYDFDDYVNDSTPVSAESTSIITTTASTDIDKTFLNDFYHLPFSDFFEKYKEAYYRNYRLAVSPELILDESKMFYTYPQPYYCVRHKCRGMKQYKWTIGEDRKTKIFMTAQIMMKNNPSMSIENLLYGLRVEREWHYINHDNKISNDVLVEKAKYSMTNRYPISETEHGMFKVNKAFWEGQGVKVMQAVNYCRYQLRLNEIKKVFNPYMSIKDNCLLLNDNGIKISERTIKRMVTRGDIQIIETNTHNTILSQCRSDVTNPVTNEILKLITYNNHVTQRELADTLQVDIRTIKRYFDEMKGVLIERVGNNRTGYWKVL